MIDYTILVDGHEVDKFKSRRILFGSEIRDKINEFCNKHKISSAGVTLRYIDWRVKK